MPDRTTSARLPVPSDQIPVVLVEVTSPVPMASRALNATMPASLRTGVRNESKVEPAGVPGACWPFTATVRTTSPKDSEADAAKNNPAANTAVNFLVTRTAPLQADKGGGP